MDHAPSGWEGIRQSYAHSGKSVARIAAEQGVSERAVSARIKSEGWVRVVPLQRLKPGRKPRIGPPPTADELRRRRIVRRLHEAVDHKLKEIEVRMAQSVDGGAQSAADSERETRSMGSLARLLAKLEEMNGKGKGAGDGAGDRIRSSEDADRLRRDLALRLERLHGAGDA